jgi:hypothetical protein
LKRLPQYTGASRTDMPFVRISHMAWRETKVKCIVIVGFPVIIVGSRMRLVHISPWSAVDVSCGLTVYILFLKRSVSL